MASIIQDLNKKLSSGSISQKEYKSALRKDYKKKTTTKLPSVTKNTTTIKTPTSSGSSRTATKTPDSSNFGDRRQSGFISTEQNKSFNKAKSSGILNQPVVSQPPGNQDFLNFKSEQEKLLKAQRRQAVSGLQGVKESALSGLAERKRGVGPRFQESERAQVGRSRTGGKGFADFLAANGLSSAGVAAEGAIQRQGTLQSNLGRLDVAKQQELESIEANKGNINQAFETDVASAEAGITAQGLQNTIAQQQRQQSLDTAERDRQESQSRYDTGLERQNLSDANQLLQQQQNQEIQNIQQFSDIEGGFQTKINEIESMGENHPQYFLLPHLKIARQQKIANIEQGQQQLQQSQSESAREQAEFRLKQFGFVANEQDAQVLGVPQGTRTADYQNQLSLAANRNRVSAPKPINRAKEFINGLDFRLESIPLTDKFKRPIPGAENRQRSLIADFMARGEETGQLTSDEADSIGRNYGITAQEFDISAQRYLDSQGLLNELGGN